jgi:hypothetical protein
MPSGEIQAQLIEESDAGLYVLILVWVIFAFTKFKWRALWFLVGMPLTGWWLIVLYVIASGCAHNIKNCP